MEKCPVCGSDNISEDRKQCSVCSTDLRVFQEMAHFPKSLSSFGEQAVSKGEFSRGATYFRFGLEISPDNVAMLKGLAECLEKSGDHKKAAATWERALEVMPDDPEALARVETLRRPAGRSKTAWKRIVLFSIATVFVGAAVLGPLEYTQNDRPGDGTEKGSAEVHSENHNKNMPPVPKPSGIRSSSIPVPEVVSTVIADMPPGIEAVAKNGGVYLRGVVKYFWEKTDLECKAKECKYNFVDLTQIEVAYPQAMRYNVRNGDSLSKLAKIFWGRETLWHKIYEINRRTIDDPGKIFVGQTIIILADSSAQRQATKQRN